MTTCLCCIHNGPSPLSPLAGGPWSSRFTSFTVQHTSSACCCRGLTTGPHTVFILLLSGWVPLLPCRSGASLLPLTLHECGGATKPTCCNENPVQPKKPKHNKQKNKKEYLHQLPVAYKIKWNDLVGEPRPMRSSQILSCCPHPEPRSLLTLPSSSRLLMTWGL